MEVLSASMSKQYRMVAKQKMNFIVITICIDSSQKILMKSHFIKALAYLIPARAYLFTVITKS